MERAAAAVGCCTSLPSFELIMSACLYDVYVPDSNDGDDTATGDGLSVRGCASLAKLSALQQLVITGQSIEGRTRG